MTLPKKRVQDVHEMYKDGIPTKEIMRHTGLTKHQIYYILNRVLGVKREKRIKKPSDDTLYELYILKEIPQVNIAKLYGVCSSTVRTWLDDAEIEKEVEKPTKDELHELYRVEKMRRKEIADMYGVSEGIVSRWINQYELAVKYNAMKKEDCLYIFNEFNAGRSKGSLAREYGKTYDWVHRRYKKGEKLAYESEGVRL